MAELSDVDIEIGSEDEYIDFLYDSDNSNSNSNSGDDVPTVVNNAGKNATTKRNTKGKKTDTKEEKEKKAHHNQLERTRRGVIKESFHDLCKAIPGLKEAAAAKGKKETGASRSQILRSAADYVKTMTSKNDVHRRDIESLKQNNNLLMAQINSLEKARRTGSFVEMAQSVRNIRESECSSKRKVPESGLNVTQVKRKKVKTEFIL